MENRMVKADIDVGDVIGGARREVVFTRPSMGGRLGTVSVEKADPLLLGIREYELQPSRGKLELVEKEYSETRQGDYCFGVYESHARGGGLLS